MNRTEIPGWAGDYVGLPFAEHGRDRTGVDCWGLVRLVLGERFGVALPCHGTDYRSTLDADGLGALIAREMRPAWRPVDGPGRAGDVALLRLRGAPMHVGVVVAPGVMLHVEQGIDSVIERSDGLRWKKRLLGIYRHEDMDDGG